MPKPLKLKDNRTPVERLTALLAERSLERARRRLDMICAQIEDGADPAPWFRAIAELQRTAMLSANEGTYLLELITDSVVPRAVDADTALFELFGQMRKIGRAHGLADDQDWTLDEAPAEWLALNDRWDARLDEIMIGWWRAAGLTEAADTLARSVSEFSGATALGHDAFASRWQKEANDPLSHFLDD